MSEPKSVSSVESVVKTPNSELNATLEQLARRGVKTFHLKSIRNRDGVGHTDYPADQIAKAIIRCGEKAPEIEDELMNFLQRNCFLPFHWSQYFGLWFSEEELAEIYSHLPDNILDLLHQESPFEGDNKSSVTLGHYTFLFYSPGRLDWENPPIEKDIVKSLFKKETSKYFFQALFGIPDWPFLERGWYLVRLDGVPGSQGSTTRSMHWENKLKLLPEGWKASTLLEGFYKTILMQLRGVGVYHDINDEKFNAVYLDDKGYSRPGKSIIRPQDFRGRHKGVVFGWEIADGEGSVHPYLSATNLRITW